MTEFLIHTVRSTKSGATTRVAIPKAEWEAMNVPVDRVLKVHELARDVIKGDPFEFIKTETVDPERYAGRA